MAYQCASSNVAIKVTVFSFHVVLLDQAIDVLLDICHSQNTSAHGGLDRLAHQLLMANRLPRFHDPHNGGLAFEVTVLGNPNVGFLVLFLSLLELDLIDLDAVFGVAE